MRPHVAVPASAIASGPPLASAAGLGGFASAMVLAIWMTDGWEVSASASEETTDAGASQRGGIVALFATTAVLLLATIAFLRLGADSLAAHATNVLDDVAESLGGGAWHVAIAVTVLVSTAATLWTTMLYLSRSAYAMGRSGVLPSALGRLDARGGPAVANVAVAASTGAATLATGLVPSLAQALQLVLNGTSIFLGLLFAVSVAAGAKLCRRAIGWRARSSPSPADAACSPSSHSRSCGATRSRGGSASADSRSACRLRFGAHGGERRHPSRNHVGRRGRCARLSILRGVAFSKSLRIRP